MSSSWNPFGSIIYWQPILMNTKLIDSRSEKKIAYIPSYNYWCLVNYDEEKQTTIERWRITKYDNKTQNIINQFASRNTLMHKHTHTHTHTHTQALSNVWCISWCSIMLGWPSFPLYLTYTDFLQNLPTSHLLPLPPTQTRETTSLRSPCILPELTILTILHPN